MGEALVIRVEEDLETCLAIPRCRICHEEEEEEEDEQRCLEAPCACSGSVMFAHRDCIQKWCNEKGNTTCELCLQEYGPGYTAPPPKKSHLPEAAVIIRAGVPRRSHRVAISGEEGHPECSFAADKSASYCRLAALTITVLLLVKHMFGATVGETDRYPFTVTTLLALKATGIVLPMYALMWIIRAIHNSVLKRRLLYHNYEDDDMSDFDE